MRHFVALSVVSWHSVELLARLVSPLEGQHLVSDYLMLGEMASIAREEASSMLVAAEFALLPYQPESTQWVYGFGYDLNHESV
jgi:hypothetical protein